MSDCDPADCEDAVDCVQLEPGYLKTVVEEHNPVSAEIGTCSYRRYASNYLKTSLFFKNIFIDECKHPQSFIK